MSAAVDAHPAALADVSVAGIVDAQHQLVDEAAAPCLTDCVCQARCQAVAECELRGRGGALRTQR